MHISGAFQHASCCSDVENKDIVLRLIQKDAACHHLFFNDDGFHNHLVHQLLADYSLGADVLRLEKVYQDNALYQRPRRPDKSGFVWDSLDCLGNDDYYTDYVNFFLEELQTTGIKRCVEHYIFEQDPKLGMFARFFAGVYHPMIHLGYGIEFGIPLMVAEGLAWVAVHQGRFQKFFGPINTSNQESNPEKHANLNRAYSLTALNIASSVYQDTRIDGRISWEDGDKYATVINTMADLLQEHIQPWKPLAVLDGTQGLRAAATELQILAATLHAGPHRQGQETMLDFFLMHTLTSSLFLHCYVELLEPPYAACLLQGKFAVDLAYYIAHGRPRLNMEQFADYSKLLSWDQIIAKAIASEDDHVPKAVRALIHASRYDKTKVFSFETYQAIASLTVNDQLYWSLDAIGFEEAWKGDREKTSLGTTRVIQK